MDLLQTNGSDERLSRLCSLCQPIFSTPLEEILNHPFEARWTSHHQTLGDLRAAACEEKCFICSKAWNHTGASALDFPPQQKIGLRYMLHEFMDDYDFGEFSLSVDWKISHELKFSQNYHICATDNPSAVNSPEREVLENSTSSKTSLSAVEGWLSECVSGHEKCGKGCTKPSYMPTRVISVGKSGDVWKLFTTEGQILSGTKYIALSYRWGQFEQFTLKSSNVDQFHAGLPISDMPKTFRDTIQVARALGVEYIWIDALCIMQDSAEDWKHESVLMRDVYSNSFCTIAAAWAPDPTAGLFSERDADNIRCGRFKTNWTLTNHPGLHTVRMMERNGFFNELMRSPLHRRAWTVQERLLPPRVIYFTKHQILFECDTARKSEAFARGAQAEYANPWMRSERLYTWFDPEKAEEADVRSSELLSHWTRTLGTYTRCQITMPGDKLVAIGGVAELLYELSGDQYLAGLWRSCIFDCLSWNVEHGEGPTQRPLKYRAPSWSWASLDAPISMNQLSSDRDRYAVHPFEVEDVHVVTDSGTESWSPRGHVLDASITLRGGTVATYDPSKHEDFTTHVRDVLYVSPIFDDSSALEPPKSSTLICFLLLRCARFRRSKYNITDGQEAFYGGEGGGIMVQRRDGHSLDWERIGSFELRDWRQERMESFGLFEDAEGTPCFRQDLERQTFRIF